MEAALQVQDGRRGAEGMGSVANPGRGGQGTEPRARRASTQALL